MSRSRALFSPHALDVFHIGNRIESFLHPVFADAHHALEGVFTAQVPGTGVELILMAASIAIAAGGIFVATRLYKTSPEMKEPEVRYETTFVAE